MSVHKCTNVTATVLEGSEEVLVEKYPAAEENIRVVRDNGGTVGFGVDVGKKGGMRGLVKGNGGVGFERVVFNFPHVGGKSTDVNRQVRYNQGMSSLSFLKRFVLMSGIVELLVSFFNSTLPLLSPRPGSSILVTLFEGPPYTLWNIRDLGRHAGLELKRSWKFQREVWKGYRHARTLGVVKGKDGKEGAGWRGEERAARMYEFVRKGEGAVGGVGAGKKNKGGEISDEDDIGLEDEELDLDEILEDHTNENRTEETWEGIETETEEHNETNESDDD